MSQVRVLPSRPLFILTQMPRADSEMGLESIFYLKPVLWFTCGVLKQKKALSLHILIDL